jgi:hypothetical protein
MPISKKSSKSPRSPRSSSPKPKSPRKPKSPETRKGLMPPMPLHIIHAHPRDASIYMDEPTHVYYLDGNPMSISGTGFLHLFFEPFNSGAVADELVRKAKVGTKYYGKTRQDILDMWAEGTQAGTRMHKNIEDFMNGIVVPHPDITDKNEYGLFAQFHKLMDKWGLEPYRTEWIIYDADADIAGSIDFVARNKKTGNLWIIDWKRCTKFSRESFQGKKGRLVCNTVDDCNGCHYEIQVNLYRYILEKNYGVRIEQCLLVNLHPDLREPDLLFAEDMQSKIAEMVQYWSAHKEELKATRH